MKRNKEFNKKLIWLTAGFFAGIHFLAAQAGMLESIQLIVPNVKLDLQDCISQPIPWKTMISILIPASIG